MMVGDPVVAGFAATFSRPGGKATGVSIQTTDLNRKRLELLRQLAPHVQRVAYLINSANPLAVPDLAEMQNGAKALGVKLILIDVQNPAGITTALQAIRNSAADGVVVTADLTLLANRVKVAGAIREARLPAVFPYREYHDAGVLMSYSPNQKEVLHRLATYVDRILKGANPADLPIEQISTYEVLIDLRVAREMHINVPQELLIRADEVIR
jgi:putative ABC transport system substrate-binding protein